MPVRVVEGSWQACSPSSHRRSFLCSWLCLALGFGLVAQTLLSVLSGCRRYITNQANLRVPHPSRFSAKGGSLRADAATSLPLALVAAAFRSGRLCRVLPKPIILSQVARLSLQRRILARRAA